jgi:hypothetical protein
MSKKIKSIRCYQAVTFEKNQNTSFSTVPIPSRPLVEISLEKLGSSTDVIEVKNNNDLVHIPMSNISGIYYYNDSDKKKAEIKAKEESNAKEVRDALTKGNRVKKAR